MNYVINFVVALALGVLQAWAAREDIKKGERQRLIIEQLKLEGAALAWLAEARRDPVRWAHLRVLPGAAAFESFHVDTTPTHVSSSGNLHTGRP